MSCADRRDHCLVRIIAAVVLVAVAGGLTGCAYLGTWAKQSYYRARLKHEPSAAITKHLLDRPTDFVFGVVHCDTTSDPIAVVARSRSGSEAEVVDVCHDVQASSYYALHLPPGEFDLLVVRDQDRDGFYRQTEVVGSRVLAASATPESGRVIGGYDLQAAGDGGVADNAPAWTVAVRRSAPQRDSLFYPRGALRSLDDTLFDRDMASLGLYSPAAFMERAPLLFYALEEHAGYKVPVIFVHGIEGSARDFLPLVNQLDRRRYQPWFFHYPSGASLDQLSRLFYEIFLSGATIPRQETPIVIVAHSMGGLVAREALNHYRAEPREAVVGALVTVASPLGGHPAAQRGLASAPVVLPSWRGLDPTGTFIGDLHRTTLPADLRYTLVYAAGGAATRDKDSDGVVPLASQLSAAAQAEADAVIGVAAGHTDVLADPTGEIMAAITAVKPIFPEDHLRLLELGGYDVPPDAGLTPMEAYIVRTSGRYLDALLAGELQPFHPDLEKIVTGARTADANGNPAVSAWLKLDRWRADRLHRR